MTNIAIPTEEIGMGYESSKGMGTSTFCVDASTITKRGKGLATIKTKYSMKGSEVRDHMDVEISGEIDMGGFSGELESKYAKSVMDTAYSTSFSFVNKIVFPTQILHVKKYGEDALNEFGKGAFLKGLDTFRSACGDKFVVQENSGATLITTFKLTFKSKWQAKLFKLAGSASMESFEVALSILNSSSKGSTNVNIEVSAMQKGGDPLGLANIFRSGEKAQDVNGEHDKKGLSSFLKCGLANKDAIQMCITSLNNVMRYAEEDFAKQISLNTGDTDKYPPSSTSYVYANYQDIGIPFYDLEQFLEDKKYFSALDKKITEIKMTVDNLLGSKITEKIEQVIPHSPWVSTWAWSPKMLDIETTAELEYSKLLANKLEEVLHSKSSGVLWCFKNPSKCSDVRKSVTSILEYEDGGKASKPATKMMDVADKLENTAPFSIVSKVLIMNVDCNKKGESSVENIYSSRVLMPIGRDNYYEDSKFTKTVEEVITTKSFYNNYEIKINDSETKIISMKVSAVSDSVTKPQECGEFDISNPESVVPYYKKALLNSGEESQGCIKALCGVSDQDLDSIDSIEVGLYEYDSPL